MGLGGFWSLFYSYWVKEKGMGMSAYGRDDFNFAALPQEEEDEKQEKRKYGKEEERERERERKENEIKIGKIKKSDNTKLWIKALIIDSGTGIIGNIITTFMTCLLAFAILHPRGLFPEGYKIAVVQSEFFRGWFGELGVKIFLFSSALFLIDTWVGTADTVAKINVDVISYFRKVDEKKLYKTFLYLITLITCATLPIAPPGELIVISAMIGFFGMCIFSVATLILNHFFLAKKLPKKAKPSALSLLLMLITSIRYSSLSISYTILKIGK